MEEQREHRRRGRPATGKTPLRNVRIADALWHPARDAAEANGETVTAVIERALRRYVADHEHAQRRAHTDDSPQETAGAQPD